MTYLQNDERPVSRFLQPASFSHATTRSTEQPAHTSASFAQRSPTSDDEPDARPGWREIFRRGGAGYRGVLVIVPWFGGGVTYCLRLRITDG